MLLATQATGGHLFAAAAVLCLTIFYTQKPPTPRPPGRNPYRP